MDSSSSPTICRISSDYKENEGRWRDGSRFKIGGSKAPIALALDAQSVCLAVLWHQQLDPLCTSTCCANTQRAPFNKELNRHSSPPSPHPRSAHPSSWLLSHSHKWNERRKESHREHVCARERDRPPQTARTYTASLSQFQMNKAEYQVPHLYTTQRQIDQSITAGSSGITNAFGW